MQGRDLWGHSFPTVTFVIGFSITSSAVYSLLWLVGEAWWDQRLPVEVLSVTLTLMAVLVVIDFVVLRKGRNVSIGLKRQARQWLSERLSPGLVGFVWGLDAGSGVSTYRVTAGTWALVLICLLGMGTPWIGSAYAFAFALPLLRALNGRSAGFVSDAPSRALNRMHDGVLRRIRVAVLILLVLLAMLVGWTQLV